MNPAPYTTFDFQKGFSGLRLIVGIAILAAFMYFFIFPSKFPKSFINNKIGDFQYCRDLINDPNARTIPAPSYKENHVFYDQIRQYKLIKQNVPIVPYVWKDPKGDRYEHTIYTFKQNYEDPTTHEKFVIRFPNGAGGRSYEFQTSLDNSLETSLQFDKYGLLLLYHVDENNEPILLKQIVDKEYGPLHIVDIYKAVDLPPLPEWVTNCIDDPEKQEDTSPAGLSYFYPKQNWSPQKQEQQLGYFLFRSNVYIRKAWWTPHCKPAIYLYPENDQQVNVKVAIPSGSFLYTDPVYPSDGWTVLAKPDGTLTYLGNDFADSKGKTNYPTGIFPYLYYEGKVADSEISKPTTGFIKKYEELASFYDEILPTLGLNAKETKEFKQYWLKALPKSPYYFIGVVPQENLNHIEPLTITPKQNTTIRVSLYFESLDTFKVVLPPTLTTPQRTGFTVVEWGGMVKQDKDHPFTCSM